MMDDLTVCRLSAEALGKPYRVTRGADGREIVMIEFGMIQWNPLLNAEQRDECRAYLLREGVEYSVTKTAFRWWPSENDDSNGIVIYSGDPDEEGPARAVAELQLRKEKA